MHWYTAPWAGSGAEPFTAAMDGAPTSSSDGPPPCPLCLLLLCVSRLTGARGRWEGGVFVELNTTTNTGDPRAVPYPVCTAASAHRTAVRLCGRGSLAAGARQPDQPQQ